MLRYEMYVCHSNKTWSDCNFIEIDEVDDLSEGEVCKRYREENPNQDIVFVGTYNVEEV